MPYKGIPNLVRRQNSGKKGKKKIRPSTMCTSCPTIVPIELELQSNIRTCKKSVKIRKINISIYSLRTALISVSSKFSRRL